MWAIPDLWKLIGILFSLKAPPPSTCLVTREHHWSTSCSCRFLSASGRARNLAGGASQHGLDVGNGRTSAAAPESGNKVLSVLSQFSWITFWKNENKAERKSSSQSHLLKTSLWTKWAHFVEVVVIRKVCMASSKYCKGQYILEQDKTEHSPPSILEPYFCRTGRQN